METRPYVCNVLKGVCSEGRKEAEKEGQKRGTEERGERRNREETTERGEAEDVCARVSPVEVSHEREVEREREREGGMDRSTVPFVIIPPLSSSLACVCA